MEPKWVNVFFGKVRRRRYTKVAELLNEVILCVCSGKCVCVKERALHKVCSAMNTVCTFHRVSTSLFICQIVL